MEGQQHLQDGQRPLRLPEQPVDPGRGCREVPDILRELSHDAGHVPLRKHHPRETNPFFISKKNWIHYKKKNIELKKKSPLIKFWAQKMKFYSKLALMLDYPH